MNAVIQEYMAGHAKAVAALQEAELSLSIFIATAYLGTDHEKHYEREAWVKSDPGFKKLSMAVIAARRVVIGLEDQMRVAEMLHGRMFIYKGEAAE